MAVVAITPNDSKAIRLEFTVLVEPGGKIVYAKKGPANSAEVKKPLWVIRR